MMKSLHLFFNLDFITMMSFSRFKFSFINVVNAGVFTISSLLLSMQNV